jgi:hypothetical protein
VAEGQLYKDKRKMRWQEKHEMTREAWDVKRRIQQVHKERRHCWSKKKGDSAAPCSNPGGLGALPQAFDKLDSDPTGIQTPSRYTDTQQVYRHPAGIQTPNRYTDTQQVYRHPSAIQTPNRYTDTQQVHRHPAGIQTPNRYTDTRLVAAREVWGPSPKRPSSYTAVHKERRHCWLTKRGGRRPALQRQEKDEMTRETRDD